MELFFNADAGPSGFAKTSELRPALNLLAFTLPM
jgi:hypothetical protein